MNFDDIKDQLIEYKEEVVSFLQEDPSINSLKERYETLPSSAQKGIVAGGVALLLVILILIPYSYFSTASENEQEYNTYKTTIRDLLKVGKGVSGSRATQRGNLDRLKGNVSSSLARFNLTDEQLQPVSLDVPSQGSLAKPPIKEETLIVKLNKLNLNQIVEIGVHLQNQFSELKMTGVNIVAVAKEAGYFNTEFQLSKYYLPEIKKPEDKGAKKRRKRK